MRYLTWKLNWQDPEYGTGPEPSINALGAVAESGFAVPNDATGTIYGYLLGDATLTGLGAWTVTEITAQASLAAARTIAPGAYLNSDGRIGFPLTPDAPGYQP